MVQHTPDTWFAETDITDNLPAELLVDKINAIGQWYDRKQTIINKRTLRQWNTLAKESAYQAKRLVKKYHLKIEYVRGQPYTLPCEMFADIQAGILRISIENYTHPIFNLIAILDQRIWHDITHYECQTNFGFTGEVETCEMQIAMVQGNDRSTRAKLDIAHALYVDIIGQVANGLIHKQFPIQKVF